MRSMELFFFGRASQCLDGGRATLNHSGHVVEVARTHFLLVGYKGVAFFTGGEFWLLHHFNVVLHAFAASVCLGKLEGVVPVDMDASQCDELVLVTEGREFFLERSDL